MYLKQRKDTTASLSIALFRDGQVTFQKHSGYMDLENKIPADKDSIYEWGSVSKTLIWVAMMQLVEKGKLDLNQSALTYLPKSVKSSFI
ncbi:serine hydrolase domain-containing protein [Streptococcus uberis]